MTKRWQQLLLAFEPELEAEFWSSLYYQRRRVLTLALGAAIILIPFSSAFFVPFAQKKMSALHQFLDMLVPAITAGIPLGIACWHMHNSQLWSRVQPFIIIASACTGIAYSILFLSQEAELAPFYAYAITHVLLLSHLFLTIPFRTLLPMTLGICALFMFVSYLQQPDVAALSGNRSPASSTTALGLVLLYASFAIEKVARQNFVYERRLKQEDENRFRTMRSRRDWLDTMTAFVKDELGNALTAVRSVQQRMRRNGIPERLETYQARSEESARVIQRMLSEVGKAKTMESALAQMRHTRIDVGEMLERKISDYRAQYPDQPFELEIADDCAMTGDEDRLTQALDKLINNAIEYSAEKTPILVSVAVQADTLNITVQNTGPLLDDLERIFDPHISAHKTADNLGLGLFVARRIVEAHAGVLTARNQSSKDSGDRPDVGKVEFSMTFGSLIASDS